VCPREERATSDVREIERDIRVVAPRERGPLGARTKKAARWSKRAASIEPGVGHEFVRRSWPIVIPAVLRISDG